MLEALLNATYANPWAFALAALAPAAAWAMLRRARRAGVKFSAFSLLPPARRTWRSIPAAAAPPLAILALLAFAVAAARPRVPGEREWKRENAVAIAMAVDISGSMLARDMLPGQTRIDIVKKTFAGLVSRRPADLIGLVTFAGYTDAAAPLTTDHETLLGILASVRAEGERRDAIFRNDQAQTAIGDGLMRALDLLRRAGTASRVVVLLSDGVNNAGIATPRQAAAAAREAGVKVYTIGAGTPSANPFADGFDERQLRGIAEATGGRYFAATDEKALEAAVDEIDRMEKTEVESVEEVHWKECFPPFLAAGAVLAFLSACAALCAKGRVA